jgi:hypothetical protein
MLERAWALRLDRSPTAELLAIIKNLKTCEEKRVAPAEAATQMRAFAAR